jgi:hypothetical protein
MFCSFQSFVAPRCFEGNLQADGYTHVWVKRVNHLILSGWTFVARQVAVGRITKLIE